MEYRIVTATAADTEQVLRLYREQVGREYCFWTDEYPGKDTVAFDLSRDSLFVMKDEGGDVVAAVSVEEDEEVDRLDCWTPSLQPGGEFARLAVTPDLQNRGLAGKMVSHVMNVLKARGFRSVHIIVNRDNIKAIRSYARFGFRTAGECEMYQQRFLCYEKELSEQDKDNSLTMNNEKIKLYFEIPGISRKDDAVEYIREFLSHGSEINGTGGLQRYLDNYEEWLEKLNEDCYRMPNGEKVPARTFFLVRNTDRRIVGMINIRLTLNERLRHYGGHMGYSIRPEERGKGYNKINLYLGLKVCHAFGIDTVLLDADLDNPASWRTMEALGGVRIRQHYDDVYAHCTVVDYRIDVQKALREHSEYEGMICPADDLFWNSLLTRKA